MNALDFPYWYGLADVPYHWELEICGRVCGGRIVSRPGSDRREKRISAQLVALHIAESRGERNPVAEARLLTELQGT